MTEPERILVTGAAGFLGSNLCRALLDAGHWACGVDDLSHGAMRNVEPCLAHPRFSFVRQDARDRTALEELARGAAAIVHLAAYKIPRYGGALDTLTNNAHTTLSVLEAARATGARVVLASTSDVYGKSPKLPFRESDELRLGPSDVKRWAYAGSKILDEHYGVAYHRERRVPVTILRFFGSYGPGQNTTWWGGPQSVFIAAALRDEPMQIHGDGLQTRSFTYVDDTVDGIVRALGTERARGEVLNIGSTVETTILDLAQLVWGLAARGAPKLEFVPYRSFGKYEDVRHRVPDIAKAREILGFEARVGLEDGLGRTIAWQRALEDGAA